MGGIWKLLKRLSGGNYNEDSHAAAAAIVFVVALESSSSSSSSTEWKAQNEPTQDKCQLCVCLWHSTNRSPASGESKAKEQMPREWAIVVVDVVVVVFA